MEQICRDSEACKDFEGSQYENLVDGKKLSAHGVPERSPTSVLTVP